MGLKISQSTHDFNESGKHSSFLNSLQKVIRIQYPSVRREQDRFFYRLHMVFRGVFPSRDETHLPAFEHPLDLGILPRELRLVHILFTPRRNFLLINIIILVLY